MAEPFDLWCEIEPATSPDLSPVRRQLETLRAVAAGFVVTDNHLGRATVSSLAVGHEVLRHGGRPVACINARDRNLLGFRRDLLTAAALGIDRLLLVYGDRPTNGERTSDLSVHAMLDQARLFSHPHAGAGRSSFEVGVTTRLGRLPSWKRDADFLFTQVSFSVPDLLRWRDSICFGGSVYAGVIVLPSAPMARRLAATVPQIRIPGELIDRVGRDRLAGVDHACRLIGALRAAGGYSGVHLVPGVRYAAMASRLVATRHDWRPVNGRSLTIPADVIRGRP
jgi:methylenetetrahydrofolate reductase (NADPH)